MSTVNFTREKTTVAIGRPVFFHFVRSDSEISGFFRTYWLLRKTGTAAFDDPADIAFIKIGVDQFSVIAVDGSRLRVDGLYPWTVSEFVRQIPSKGAVMR